MTNRNLTIADLPVTWRSLLGISVFVVAVFLGGYGLGELRGTQFKALDCRVLEIEGKK